MGFSPLHCSQSVAVSSRSDPSKGDIVSKYGSHLSEHLEISWFALLLNPRENAARKLGKVVHGHLLVEGLEQGVHENLHLKCFHY